MSEKITLPSGRANRKVRASMWGAMAGAVAAQAALQMLPPILQSPEMETLLNSALTVLASGLLARASGYMARLTIDDATQILETITDLEK